MFAFLTVQPEFGIKDYLLDIFFIDPLYANGWFLTYIAVWYLVFYIVMRTRDRLAERFSDFIAQTVKWMIMGAVCFYIFVFCREIWAEQALSFAFGILLSEKKDTEVYEKIQDWKISLLLFIIATVFLAFKQTSFIREAPEIVMKVVQLMIKLPYGCVVIMLPLILNLTTLLRRLFEKANGIFFSIGTISFELYLIHGYVLGGCGEGLLDAVIWCILTGIISVGFAWMNQRIRTVALYKQK